LHFTLNVVEIYLQMTILCCFNHNNPHFSALRALSSLTVVYWLLWKEPVCWWWDEDANLWDGHSYCRCSKWPPLAAIAK